MIRTLLKRAASYAIEPIVICLLGLPATVPLWTSSLPRSFDGVFHLFRLLEIDHLARQWMLLPRWAPDFVFGYGHPIFNFVPLLPYYVTDIFHIMGLSLVHTVLLSFSVALLGSGIAMYIFVRDIFGSKAAILSAVAYMYAPFHLYDMLLRGHLPGAWAMVLYPLVLWSCRRLIQSGGLTYFAMSALLYAGCLLTHNPANLIFTPFLLFYLTVLVLLRGERRAAAAFRAAATVLVGAGLAAFFWLPALWERQFIQLDRMVTPPDLDYHNHFISLADLIALPGTANTGLMNPVVPNSLGPVLISLSLLSVIGLWKLRDAEARTQVVISLCGLAGVLFMVLPQSVHVWESLPLLQYLIFPHRFLRLGCLLMAILCGAAVRLFPDRKGSFSPSFTVTLVSTGMIIVSAFSLLYPPYYARLPLNPTFADMMEFERTTHTIGTTSFGEYLPVWVDWIPRTSPLEPMYLSSSTIERLDRTSLPGGARIIGAQYTPRSATIDLDTPEMFVATFNIQYFPGWRAYVDGQKTAVSVTPGLGLTGVAVPSGSHVVQLRFEDTPVRTVSEAISALSMVMLVVPVAISLVRRVRSRRASCAVQSGISSLVGGAETGHVDRWQTAALATMGAALLVIKIGVLDSHDSCFKRDFDGLTVAEAQTSLHVNFGDLVTMLGYDLTLPNPRPGDTMTVTLYWKSGDQLHTDYSAFVHLVDEQMNIYAQQDSLNPGRYPTRLWNADEYNKDSHDVIIPPGTPPGEYLLGVGLYDQATFGRLPILEEEGHEIGMYFLEPVIITRPERPPSIEELGIQYPAGVHFDNRMTLLGSTPERESLLSGDFYRLALFWKADAELDDSYSVAIRILNSDGETVLSHTSEPSAGRYPTTEWRAGEIVRDNHAMWIPRDFPQDDYVIEIALVDAEGHTIAIRPGAATPAADGWLELLSVEAGG